MRFKVVVLALIAVALALLVGAAATHAAPVGANGVAQQTTVQFQRHNDQTYSLVGVAVCFSGDFPKQRTIYGDVRWDLPITLSVKVMDVRRKNEDTGKSQRQPGSQRTYRYNPKTNSDVVNDLPGTPAFYRVYPRSIEPQTCSQVLLAVKGAKAGPGKSLITTGKMRVGAGSSGQFLGKSLWAWQIESIGASIIWEGTDSFINICINDSKEIRSSGGRLYCRYEAFEFYKITPLG